MAACPALQVLAGDPHWSTQHARGLDEIARTMADSTTESLEAHRYIEALRQLVATERMVLALRHSPMPNDRAERILG